MQAKPQYQSPKPPIFICAIDSFKGCLESRQANEAARQGILAAISDAEVVPIVVADGGEGTVEALTAGLGGKFFSPEVLGPLGDPVRAQYGILTCASKPTAIIEMAAAAGLTLIPEEKRDPWRTTTFGLGQLILHAMDQGVRDFLIGIGGSATNDAGTGMLQALGWRFFDRNGQIIQNQGGQILSQIADFDNKTADSRLAHCRFTVACDVRNPFCGQNGAACVFGPQKGASLATVEKLDKGMANLAAIIHRKQGRDLDLLPGSGAAGGLGGGLAAFLNARLVPGIELVLESQGFDKLLKEADLVFTGEGRMDAQTASGKVVAGIARLAELYGVPVVAIGGAAAERKQINSIGVTAAFSIQPGPVSLSEAMNPDAAANNIQETVEQICRLYAKGRQQGARNR